MPDVGNVQKGLLEQATEEQSFRKQIIAGLIQVLKNPRVDPALRLLIVSALVTALGLSFLFVIFLVCKVVELFSSSKHADPRFFVVAMLVLLGLFMVLAITLAFKAGTTEQSLRLDDSFDRIYRARFAG